MKTQIDTAALVAQFLAKGKTVTVVATGLVAIEKPGAIWAASLEGKRIAGDATRLSRESEARHHAQVDAYTAAKADGWSTSDAQDYAQHAEV